MPCGFPGLGIPPLAPLKINHKEVDINTQAIKVHGVIDHFSLNGLNDFDITEMKVNAILSKVTYRLNFRNVNVDTSYDLKVLLKKFGFTIDLIGDGPAKFAIKDMEIWGVIKYSLGVLTGKLKLKTLEVRTHIGDIESDIDGMLGHGIINHRLNSVIALVAEEVVNGSEDIISDTIESIALPIVNDVLEEAALTDLVGIIAGGDDKDACVPPEF